jgi:hypothetical protein
MSVGLFSRMALEIEVEAAGKKTTVDLNFGLINIGPEKMKEATAATKTTTISGFRHLTNVINKLVDSI